MSKHSLIPKLVVGLAAGGLVLGTAAPAMAATSGPKTPTASSGASHKITFQQAKADVEHQLALRQGRLAVLTAQVNASVHLSTADRATLQGDLSAETAGINALAAKVPNDTTWAELGADAKAMVSDYRVFVVMSPQVHLTIAADTETVIEQKLTSVEPKIEALINYEKSKGKNVTAAQIAYEALVAEVTNATGDTNGVAAAVLGTSPAGWPANESIFVNGLSSLEQGRAALITSRADIHTIGHDLGFNW